jgi:predicted nucleic acid-binding protein
VTSRVYLDASAAVKLVVSEPESASGSSWPPRWPAPAVGSSALELGDELDAFVTYDPRQADAARELGLSVASPA